MKNHVLLLFLVKRYRYPLLIGCSIALMAGVLWLRYDHRSVEQQWQLVPDLGVRVPLGYAIHGIDVSRHNSRIDWQRVRRVQVNGVPLQFAFIKATEGATLIDKSFARNWTGAGQAGLRRGAYHFYHPTRDPVKQADNFIRRVTLKTGDFAPVLDFEVMNGQPDANILRDLHIWLDAIEDHYGQKPIIYTNAYLYKRFIKGHLADYPLWIADYSNAHLRQYDQTNLYLWQHNKSGLVPGIAGMVDINTFVQEPDDLQKICL
ncbi:MAG: glycoside hydrolase [Bacteroidetes bacterium]|nr:glycoside hydrolase [Fibrella sp.]